MTKNEQASNLKKASIYTSIFVILVVAASSYLGHKTIEDLNEISKVAENYYPLTTFYIIKVSIPSFLSCAFLYISGARLKSQRGILNKFYEQFGRKIFLLLVLSVCSLGFLTTVFLVLILNIYQIIPTDSSKLVAEFYIMPTKQNRMRVQYQSDIPTSSHEVVISEFREEDGFSWYKKTECLLNGEVVGQRFYDKHGNLMNEEPVKNPRPQDVAL